MLTRLWTIGVKVEDLERELVFHRRIGHDIVLDETVTVNDRAFRVVLLRMGDKYLHLFEEAVYEGRSRRGVVAVIAPDVAEIVLAGSLDEVLIVPPKAQPSLFAEAFEDLPGVLLVKGDVFHSVGLQVPNVALKRHARRGLQLGTIEAV